MIHFIQSKKYFLWIAKLALGMGLIWWLVRSGRFDVKLLLSIRYGQVLFAIMISQFLMMLFPVVRWYFLARAIGLKLSFRQAVYIGFIGYYANIFLPTGIGIDGARLVYTVRWNKNRTADILSSIIMDRVLGIAAMALVGFFSVGLLWFYIFDNRLVRLSYFLAPFICAPALIIMVLFSRRAIDYLKNVVPWKRAHQIVDSFRNYRQCKQILIIAILFSIVTHVSSIMAAWLGLMLLGSQSLLLEVFAFTPIVNLSGMLPITPAGLGVAESVANGLYQSIGIAQGAEVTMLLRAITILFSLFGAILTLLPFWCLYKIPVESKKSNL